VGVSPRLSGRSSPGGDSSLGGTSSALSGPGGAAAATHSSGAGVVGAVSLALLRSSLNKSEISMIRIRTPIPSPTALPEALSSRLVLNLPNRIRTSSIRPVLFRLNRPHMLWPPPLLLHFFSYATSPTNHTVGAYPPLTPQAGTKFPRRPLLGSLVNRGGLPSP
jgi:hypothetical protein